MNYEVQQALGNKVDNWKHHSLEQKVDSLERDKNKLERQIGNLESKLSNYYYVIEQMISMIAEKEIFHEEYNQLHQLKQNL